MDSPPWHLLEATRLNYSREGFLAAWCYADEEFPASQTSVWLRNLVNRAYPEDLVSSRRLGPYLGRCFRERTSWSNSNLITVSSLELAPQQGVSPKNCSS